MAEPRATRREERDGRASMPKLAIHWSLVDELHDIKADVRTSGLEIAELKGKLGDGLQSRVRAIEKMQWWQIGILVALVGTFIFGLWYLVEKSTAATRELNLLLKQHIEETNKK